jgi:anti-anti-sigma factor
MSLPRLDRLWNCVGVDHGDAQSVFSATTVLSGDTATVVVVGEVDVATAPRMYAAATNHPAGSLTLDLRRVSFFDSAAIHALIKLTERYPGALTVLPSGQVRRILEITGLADQPWLQTD